MEPLPFRIAISATFTAEPIEPVLAFWGRRLKSSFGIRFAPYNQTVQALMNPAGEFVSNQHGVNVLLARLEDLAQFDAHHSATLGRIEANFNHLIDVVRAAPSRMSVPIVFVLCPPSPAFLSDPGRARFVHEMTMRAEAILDETPGIQYLSYEEIQRLYPVLEPASPEGERLGRIPYNNLYFCALGTALVRLAHGLFHPPYKVIALDCDYTLWNGICGEDGPRGIVVDAPRHALQEFMADQHEAGMLLVMASKNNEQDVIDTFEQNPDMPLQLRHFVSWRLDWQSKALNLTSLARELSIGLDSFILVDDNPKESAEVEESLPEVLALTLPDKAAEIPHFLKHVWAFDHLVITQEDRERNAYYAQAQEFGRELRNTASLEHFFETLELRVTFNSLTPEHLPRAAQLTQRTNQFNFTTVRRTEQELQALVAGEIECLTVHVSDRFGEYGLVGLVLFRQSAEALEIDSLLLSCRVLGKGVEHRVMAYLADEAIRRGVHTVVARLHVTAKNQPARQFLHDIGAPFEEPSEGGLSYHFPVAMLHGLKWKPSSAEAEFRPVPPRSAYASARKRVDYSMIAGTLSTPAQVLEAMRHESRQSRSGASSLEMQMTETEARLAEIWSDLLHKATVVPSDNFFDLGGHSLLAVLLMMRVRDAFGVELPVDDVYSATLTLGELARKIETYQVGDPHEYHALLKEIQGLSDEEVDRLLAEEDPGTV